MKRIILISLLLIPFYMVSNAQIKFGVKGGITTTSIKADDIIDVNDASDIDELVVKGKNAKVGFQGGVMARVTIMKLYVQPELLFTSTSGEVQVSGLFTDGTAFNEVREQKYRQLDIPIMVGYKVAKFFRIQAGPVGTIVLSSDPALDMFDNVEVKEEFNGATWGYQIGLGLDFGEKITIDAKYEGNLSKLADGVNIGDNSYNFDSRNNQFVVSLGFFF